jgi:hypothetical protein
MGTTLTEPLPVDRSNPGYYAWPTVDYAQDNLVAPEAANPVSTVGTTASSTGIAALVDVGDMLVITSGLYAGAQRRIAAESTADSVTLSAAFPGNVTAATWAKRAPDRGNNSQRIIDPQSGLLMRRISGPDNDWTTSQEGITSSAASGGAGWMNANTTALNTADGTAATYTGDGSNAKLFVHPNVTATDYNDNNRQLTYIQLQITGSSTGTGEDAKVNLCLTADGVTCKSATLDQDLTACGSGCVIGTRFPLLASWINPAGVNASIVSSVELTGANGGVLIWKTTASETDVSIDYLRYYIGLANGSAIWSGQYPACAAQLVQQKYNGTIRDGYHCMFGPDNKVYWVAKDNADAVLIAVNSGSDAGWTLGNYGTSTGPHFDATDPNSWYGGAARTDGGTGFVKVTYDAENGKNLDRGPYDAGNYQQHFNISATEITSGSFQELLTAFTAAASPTFESSVYTNCGFGGVKDGRYLEGFCWTAPEMIGWRGYVDSQGTQAGQMIAATSTHSANHLMRFCTLHSGGGDQSWNGWTTIGTNSFAGSATCRGGPYQTTLAAQLNASDSVACPDPLPFPYRGDTVTDPEKPQCSVMQISTDLYDPTPCASENSNPGDPPSSAVQLQALRPGDILRLGSSTNSERVQVLSKDTCDPDEPCNLVVLRAVDYWDTTPNTHAAGTTAYAMCSPPLLAASQGMSTSWNFLGDPHGTSIETSDRAYIYYAHPALGRDLVVSGHNGGHHTYTGTVPEMSAKSWARAHDSFVDYSFRFAGTTGDPTIPANQHPNANQLGWPTATFILDGKSDLGPLAQTWTAVGGSAALYSSKFMAKRQRFQGGNCGMKPLIDVTPGPIVDGSGGYYTFCLGECGQGGAADTAYVNCPDFWPTSPITCNTMDNSSAATEICVFNSGAMFTYSQHDIRESDAAGRRTRAFGNLGAQYRRVDAYKQMRATFDDKWAFVTPRWLHGARTDVFAVKLPPMNYDSISRVTYQPISIQLGSVPVGTSNVIAEFGYDPDFRCGSGQETCIANQAVVNEASPFYWGSETYSGLPCGFGCSITIPAIPQRVVYYRLKYRDAGSAEIATTSAWVAVSP